MFKPIFIAATLTTWALIGAAPAMGADSKQERRAEIQAMRATVLKDLYRVKPDTKAQIAASPGYAVFNNKNVNVLIASFGGGYGIVHDNKTGSTGAAVSGEVLIDGITVYQLTEHGLALQATLKGTKYFKDSELNN